MLTARWEATATLATSLPPSWWTTTSTVVTASSPTTATSPETASSVSAPASTAMPRGRATSVVSARRVRDARTSSSSSAVVPAVVVPV